MKRTKIIILSLLLLLLAGGVSAKTMATLYNPTNGNKQVVFLNDKVGINNLFSYGYELFTDKNEQKLGVSLPNLVAVFQTSLATKITATATTTMTLVSGTTADGTTLSGDYAFIIDEGSSNQEFVLATCANTACTNLTRGVSVIDGKTSVAALKKAHGRGATVKITNYPQLTLLTNIFKGTETVPAVMSYDSAISTTSFSNSKMLASKEYVDSVAIAGSPDSTTSAKGIGKISSAPSVASNPIFLNSEEVATTTGANKVVRANSSGFINSNWLGENYTLSTTTFNGISTFNGLTKVSTSTPTVAGQVVGLDGTAKLPAIDGSKLTNLPVEYNFIGVGSATTGKTYYSGMIPFISTPALWTKSNETVADFFNGSQLSPSGINHYAQALISNPLGDTALPIDFGGKKVITEFSFKVNSTSQDCFIGLSSTGGAGQVYNSAAYKRTGFSLSAGNLYAHTSNAAGGAGHTETQITGITLTNLNYYRIEYNPGVDALFYVNGVLKATITTNLPTSGSSIYFGIGGVNTTNYISNVSAPLIAIER